MLCGTMSLYLQLIPEHMPGLGCLLVRYKHDKLLTGKIALYKISSDLGNMSRSIGTLQLQESEKINKFKKYFILLSRL